MRSIISSPLLVNVQSDTAEQRLVIERPPELLLSAPSTFFFRLPVVGVIKRLGEEVDSERVKVLLVGWNQ